MLDNLRENFLTSPDISGLPPAVRERIQLREWSNENLLRAIQLAIVSLFCIIYAFSPKTYSDGTFAAAPYVLAAYFTLALIGLIWGQFRDPPDWASYVSIIFDFALLYGLMVSFHIQYGQPASFILKAPALLYVFIFIAIRALRFHPKFVIAAGAAAMAGWAAVIIYVVRVDPGDNMLTRSYVEYLTSNSILLGAELDKILSILMVTAVLAIAMNGSNNLMVRAITEQTAAHEFSRFFDSSVARTIRSAETPVAAGQGEKWHSAIMNVDIRGFSRLAETMEADAVMRVLSAYQGRVMPLVARHGGIIDKFMGDGIMTAFGLGRNDQAYAADALRCAEDILRDLPNWPRDEAEISRAGAIRIGIGISSGVVNWGAVGRGDRLEMTAIGPAVNLSAKLEKHNKALGTFCVVDRRSWDLARKQGYDGALQADFATAPIDGIENPVEIAILSLPELSPVALNKIEPDNAGSKIPVPQGR